MKIALLHNHVGGKAGGGGGVRLMIELAAGLERLGHRVTVAVHDHEESEFGESARGLDIRAVQERIDDPFGDRRGMAERYWSGMAKVARLVPDDVDVVNAHEWPGLRAGWSAARRLKVPWVWTRNDDTMWERAIVPHDVIESDGRAAKRLLSGVLGLPDLLAARAADELVVLSNGQVRMAERSYRRPAVRVPMGPADAFFDPPDRTEARRRLGVADDTFLAVGAAILFPHRRFEDMIEAIALLGDEPRIEALIIGSDHADLAYSDRLTALIDERGVGERVSLPRRSVSEAELRDAYAAADVFVFPNQRQTWGLAPLEALAAGTPAIVSSGAGVHEILLDRPGVRIVPPEQPAAIADALRGARAADDRAAAGPTRDWLRSELTNDRYAEKMAGLYERAIANARKTVR